MYKSENFVDNRSGQRSSALCFCCSFINIYILMAVLLQAEVGKQLLQQLLGAYIACDTMQVSRHLTSAILLPSVSPDGVK